MALINDGIPMAADLEKVLPSQARLAQGPVCVVECFQSIPCNPCVKACPRGAITMPGSINDLPEVDHAKCNGCGLCVLKCPGLAIFVVDMTYSSELALVKLPYEYVPLPKVGDFVTGLDRSGQDLGRFEVERVLSGGAKNKTLMISLKVPKALAMEIRNIKVGGER